MGMQIIERVICIHIRFAHVLHITLTFALKRILNPLKALCITP